MAMPGLAAKETRRSSSNNAMMARRQRMRVVQKLRQRYRSLRLVSSSSLSLTCQSLQAGVIGLRSVERSVESQHHSRVLHRMVYIARCAGVGSTSSSKLEALSSSRREEAPALW